MTTKERIEHWLTVIPEKIELIAKNRLIVAAGLLLQGISMAFHPDRVPGGIVQGIGTTMVIASVIYLVTTLIIQKQKLPARTAGITILIAAAGLACYCWHQTIAPFLRYLIGGFLLLTGGTGMATQFRFQRLTSLGNQLLKQNSAPMTSLLPESEVTEQVDKTVQEQINRNISPAIHLLNRLNRTSVGSWISNGMIFLLGISVMLFPFQSGDALFRFSGIVVTTTGLSELWTALLLVWKKRKYHGKPDMM